MQSEEPLNRIAIVSVSQQVIVFCFLKECSFGSNFLLIWFIINQPYTYFGFMI